MHFAPDKSETLTLKITEREAARLSALFEKLPNLEPQIWDRWGRQFAGAFNWQVSQGLQRIKQRQDTAAARWWQRKEKRRHAN